MYSGILLVFIYIGNIENGNELNIYINYSSIVFTCKYFIPKTYRNILRDLFLDCNIYIPYVQR